jgi:hypothetical protein
VLQALLKLYNQHVRQFKFGKPEDAWAVEDRLDGVKRPAESGGPRLI